MGGRPAGASLAARLGERGRRVLVIDRATFPSLPSVPSCPVIYPATMAILEEIGVFERDYADSAVKSRSVVMEFHTHFAARIPIVETHGRDYLYTLARPAFDLALWNNLARFPTVTTREGFAFDDVIRDPTGRVIGIEGHAQGGEKERILAGCVVGADGRFSAVARMVGAKIVEDRPEHMSTVYLADWEGLLPFEGEPEPQIHVYVTGRGADILQLPGPHGHTTLFLHMRADRVDIRGDAEAFYVDALRSYDAIRRRLAGARQVTPVIGLKRIANRYLQAGGPGWVLAGDALHHKDPIDGQGIFDALLATKILAEALDAVETGRRTFDQAVAWYETRVREETHPIFLVTLERLARELYEEPPEIVVRTLIRWLLNDPEYQRQFLLYLSRSIHPQGWLSPSLLCGAAMRGMLGDLRGFVDRVRGARAGKGGAVPPSSPSARS